VERFVAALKSQLLRTFDMSSAQASQMVERILCGTSRTSSGADS
jgi:hypothetical protein